MTKKLTDLAFFNLLESLNNNGFYDYYRTSITTKDGKKIYGTMYKICRKLSDDDKKVILSYPNTMLYISQCQYAPEIKGNCVLLLDRKIRSAT